MSIMVSETLREVTSRLDDGHYSVVATLRERRLYLAEKAGKRFVLKTADGAKGLEMLKREYELSIGLSHPSLAYVFTWEEDSPVGPCIVQEYVDGRSLSRWLAEKPTQKERRRVFAELLSVVEYLHRKGIIHNDLTPENILISRADNALKLIDLGFADSDACIQKALGGTLGYASPELVAGAPVDARSDIYSLGRLMREVFPRRYRRIASRCLHADPARRYPSVATLASALRRRIVPLWIALGLVATALLAWPLLRSPKPAPSPIPAVVDSLQTALDSLQTGIDSLQTDLDSLNGVIASNDAAAAANAAALAKAKARVEAVYSRAIPAYRAALRAATTPDEVTAVWLALGDDLREVNFDIPDSSPEPIRPALRDYILSRNNTILHTLSADQASRLRELSAEN